MIIYVNLLFCVLFLVVLGLEAHYIMKRNKKIFLRGKSTSSFPLICLILVLFILPIQESSDQQELLRNIELLIVIFAAFGVKRGISTKGIVNFFHIVLWKNIRSVKISPAHAHHVLVHFETEKKAYSLLFHITSLPLLLNELNKHLIQDHILIDPNILT